MAKDEKRHERPRRAYQDQITGHRQAAGSYVYKVSGGGATADFDGHRDGTLIEAKGPGYAWAVRDGQFRAGYNGASALVEQGARQARVAKALGVPLEWDVAEPQTADAIKALFRRHRITGITVRYVPPAAMSFYLGAYWGPRRETAGRCAHRLARCLACVRASDVRSSRCVFHARHGRLSRWAIPTGSSPRATS